MYAPTNTDSLLFSQHKLMSGMPYLIDHTYSKLSLLNNGKVRQIPKSYEYVEMSLMIAGSKLFQFKGKSLIADYSVFEPFY